MPHLDLIPRKNDVITGAADLQFLAEFPEMPIHMGVTGEPQASDLIGKMEWGISPASGCVQLMRMAPLDILYNQAHGSGTSGASWLAHHRAFADFIGQYKPSNVLEIGGGHGILSREYQRENNSAWTIIEPNPAPVEGVRARYISGLVDESFTPDQDYDAVVHSHVLEHIYSPQEFLNNLARILPEDAWQFCSVPNMRQMFAHNYTNVLNWEHTYLLTEEYLECMAAKAGFETQARYYFGESHSIFYALRKVKKRTVELPPPPRNLYEDFSKMFTDYIRNLKNTALEINRIAFQAKEAGATVFIFGAHVLAQYLLTFGLNEQHLSGVLDNDPNKHGKRLCGTSLGVFAPEHIANMPRASVITRMGVFTQEIIEQLKTLNPDVQII